MWHRMVMLALVLCVTSCGSSSARSSSSMTAGANSAVAQGSNPPCGPRGAHTLAASRVARVYVVHSGVYGCAVSAESSYGLGAGPSSHTPGQPHVTVVAVAGAVTAYGLRTSGVDTVSSWVVVRRLTDGRQVRSASATSGPSTPEFFQSVDSIVVKRDDAVAWIASGGSVFSNVKRIQLQRFDKLGQALLDSGAQVSPSSLRLHGSTLTWRHGTTTRHAKLH